MALHLDAHLDDLVVQSQHQRVDHGTGAAAHDVAPPAVPRPHACRRQQERQRRQHAPARQHHGHDGQGPRPASTEWRPCLANAVQGPALALWSSVFIAADWLSCACLLLLCTEKFAPLTARPKGQAGNSQLTFIGNICSCANVIVHGFAKQLVSVTPSAPCRAIAHQVDCIIFARNMHIGSVPFLTERTVVGANVLRLSGCALMQGSSSPGELRNLLVLAPCCIVRTLCSPYLRLMRHKPRDLLTPERIKSKPRKPKASALRVP